MSDQALWRSVLDSIDEDLGGSSVPSPSPPKGRTGPGRGTPQGSGASASPNGVVTGASNHDGTSNGSPRGQTTSTPRATSGATPRLDQCATSSSMFSNSKPRTNLSFFDVRTVDRRDEKATGAVELSAEATLRTAPSSTNTTPRLAVKNGALHPPAALAGDVKRRSVTDASPGHLQGDVELLSAGASEVAFLGSR
jgi:hypothetical protein